MTAWYLVIFPDSGLYFPRLRTFSSRFPATGFRKSGARYAARASGGDRRRPPPAPQASVVTVSQGKVKIMKG
jgi:hypothetical protein